MKYLFLALPLALLAGCAASGDKAARVDVPERPNAPVAQTAVAETEPEREQVALSVPAVPQTDSAAARSVEPSGWEQLSRRVIAWGDPMRRSMEQYCTAQVATYKP